jgi:hypothetical protein
VEGGQDGTNDLVLRQLPILEADNPGEERNSIVLARDVSRFSLEFMGPPGTAMASRTGDWLTEWPYTNALPWVVRFTLAFGRNVDAQGRPKDLTVRTVHIPSIVVPGGSSMGAGAGPVPGAAPPMGPGQQPPGAGGGAPERFRPGRQVPGGLPGANGGPGS